MTDISKTSRLQRIGGAALDGDDRGSRDRRDERERWEHRDREIREFKEIKERLSLNSLIYHLHQRTNLLSEGLQMRPYHNKLLFGEFEFSKTNLYEDVVPSKALLHV